MIGYVIEGMIVGVALLIIYRWGKNSSIKQGIDFEESIKRSIHDDINHVVNLVYESATTSFNKIREAVDLADLVEQLQTQLSALKIDKSRIEEDYARKERELEHKIGLERIRQRQDVEIATKEATLKVREENLKLEKEMFSKQVEAVQKRFEDQLHSQNDLINNLLKALPNMNIIKTEHTENVNRTRE